MLEADGNAPSASSAAAPPRSLKLSESTPTLMPVPLTFNPLSSSACCTCAAVAPPAPTLASVIGPEVSCAGFAGAAGATCAGADVAGSAATAAVANPPLLRGAAVVRPAWKIG